MTMLLLTNPFTPQQPPPGAPTEAVSPKALIGISPSAVTPARASASGPENKSSTAYPGSGSGAGGDGAQQPAAQNRATGALSSATPRSVVTAQAASYPFATRARTDENNAPEALGPQQKVLIVANEMPDPLPTSPFLKGANTD